MIIDGKSIAKALEQNVKQAIKQFSKKPVLAVVLVGDDPASKIYVASKQRACKRVGIEFKLVALKQGVKQEQLDQTLKNLSAQNDVTAILLQLPLPRNLDARQAISFIDKSKDVDGLTLGNLGSLIAGEGKKVLPCTPLGVMHLIKTIKQDLTGLHACVVGRSTLVGKPLALMLLQEHATVTVCHSKTKNLQSLTKKADILISATGVKGLITSKHIKPGAVVIDVGIGKDQNGQIYGDVNFKACFKKAGHITPVPGGVGPMTIAYLLFNVLTLAENLQKNA